ncbi:MAG: winged helix-turn-helix transcriptional regulator [Anaerolineaceae bacterium]
MNQTQRAIIHEMKKHPSITSAELARILELTPSDIRHHLAGLLAEGWVVMTDEQPAKGRGRPAHRYQLGSRAKSEAISSLLQAVMKATILTLPENEQTAALHRVAESLAGSTPPSPSMSISLTRTVNRLNELGYRARWEARAGAPRIYLDYSPYENIAKQIPLLQTFDAILLENLLQRPVRQDSTEINQKYHSFLVG